MNWGENVSNGQKLKMSCDYVWGKQGRNQHAPVTQSDLNGVTGTLLKSPDIQLNKNFGEQPNVVDGLWEDDTFAVQIHSLSIYQCFVWWQVQLPTKIFLVYKYCNISNFWKPQRKGFQERSFVAHHVWLVTSYWLTMNPFTDCWKFHPLKENHLSTALLYVDTLPQSINNHLVVCINCSTTTEPRNRHQAAAPHSEISFTTASVTVFQQQQIQNWQFVIDVLLLFTALSFWR